MFHGSIIKIQLYIRPSINPPSFIHYSNLFIRVPNQDVNYSSNDQSMMYSHCIAIELSTQCFPFQSISSLWINMEMLKTQKMFHVEVAVRRVEARNTSYDNMV